ncbi:hypothetical protein COA08_20705 [Bacillus cereus]|uniref:Group-specific protein n=1 Tax=Bacillus cereus TaxID=1396 RepID=A0A2A8UBM1_BACCE|nr:hypothetical protein CON06_16365 [Bacillus cereus]PFA17251.1 hypothetical protein CN382_03670 [Bacillus cereus]PFM30412.1 hypothetical protein COJ43_29220 [Bacillus cereus]PGL60771.1 hypothetical protein CN927_13260 [Bacillus cereus]PGQ06922.1 hypothetical protein COA08_20705 [Bacillus cereus]
MTEDKKKNFIQIITILGNSSLIILAILVTIPSYTEFRTTLEIIFLLSCLLLIYSKYLSNNKKAMIPYIIFLILISLHLVYTLLI